MAEFHSSAGEKNSPGVLRSLSRVSAIFLGSVQTRLELFVTELEEERERLKQSLLLALLLVFGFGFGFILLNIFAIGLFWRNGWIFAIGVLAAIYFAVGITAACMLRRKILIRPGLFPSTLAELKKDCDRLRSSSDA